MIKILDYLDNKSIIETILRAYNRKFRDNVNEEFRTIEGVEKNLDIIKFEQRNDSFRNAMKENYEAQQKLEMDTIVQ